MENPTSTVEGRYEVKELLGTGGMGTIHRAFDRLAQRDVAYKRLRVSVESNRPALTRLFRREYDTLARLEHPNIVSVYEFGVDSIGPFYAMELVSGDDLAKRSPLPYVEACRILRDVASALALVHARRLVHRDVSPNNVRLTTQGMAKLIDFGALVPFGVPTEVVGTPAFIPPECLTTEPIDQRVDLYALGGLAYWVLTRKVAVGAYSIDALPQAWTAPIPPPSALVSDIPPELDELVLSLLAHDRMARPATAADVVERLINIAGLAPEQDERRVALSYLKHSPLQGRDALVSSFARNLDGLSAGRGCVLLIEGGPGSGRTAALDRLSIDAQLRGATVLRSEGKVHTGPLDAATHLVRTSFAIYPDLARSADGTASIRVEAPTVSNAVEAAERHARIARAVKQTLLKVSLRGALVILVDDTHLVDKPSLALLTSLVEALPRHPILLALTRFSGPATTDAEAILQAAAERVTLAPLPEPEVAALVETMFGGVPNSLRVARWLFAESGGNPAHCMDLVGLLLRRGSIRYTRGTFSLPHDIDEQLSQESSEMLLSDRLTGIGPDAERIVRLLSLEDSALDVAQLTDASGLHPAAVVEGLRRLDEHNAVVESAGRVVLASRALARIVRDQLAPDESRSLHLALARIMKAGSAPALPAQLAAGLHLIRAGGDEELVGAHAICELAIDNPSALGVGDFDSRPITEALAVFEKHGYSELDCAYLLVPLSIRGFFGDLAAQRQYLERAVRATGELSGLSRAMRLKRWLGGGLALFVGILLAFIIQPFRRSRVRKVSPRAHLVGYTSTVNTAIAASACALDTIECERIVRWLDVLAAAPKGSAGNVSREFSMAVAETSAGKLRSAIERYRYVLQVAQKPVPDLDDLMREQLRHGALHGIAQSSVEDDPESALKAADELAKTAFFAPHAEVIRMFHHGFRGERALAEQHRTRAEALALLGGVSWSAVVLLNARAYVYSLLNDDAVELVRLTAEFERLASLSPALAAQHRLAQADLLRIRGRPGDALPIYAEVLESEVGRKLPTYAIASAWYARALVEAGQAAQAKTICETLLSSSDRDASDNGHILLVTQQLALAEATLGDGTRAAARLDALIEQKQPTQNPLLLGSLHRDRAKVALLSGDTASFDRSFLAMQEWFGATQNPWLFQQADALLSRAVRAGMRPAVTVSELHAIEGSSTDMDGSTVLQRGAHDEPSELDAATVIESTTAAGPTVKQERSA
jgi:hypothetical protein